MKPFSLPQGDPTPPPPLGYLVSSLSSEIIYIQVTFYRVKGCVFVFRNTHIEITTMKKEMDLRKCKGVVWEGTEERGVGNEAIIIISEI